MTNTKERIRVFTDMDGTTCCWKNADTFEELLEPGFYSSMYPNIHVVKALKILAERHSDEIELFSLSAVLREAEHAREEKDGWLDSELGVINRDHRVYCFCDECKSDSVPGGIRPTDVLLDDYSKNLSEWSMRAKALKLLNGINGTKGTWKGATVSKFTDPEILAEQIYWFATAR